MVSSSSIKERFLEDTSDAPHNLLVFGRKKSGMGAAYKSLHPSERRRRRIWFSLRMQRLRNKVLG
jgi:hypothetical protein